MQACVRACVHVSHLSECLRSATQQKTARPLLELPRCHCVQDMEVQSLVRPPVVRNGKRAIHAVYNVAGLIYLTVAITGYW